MDTSEEMERIRAAITTLSEGRYAQRRLNDAARILEGLVKMSASYKNKRRPN